MVKCCGEKCCGEKCCRENCLVGKMLQSLYVFNSMFSDAWFQYKSVTPSSMKIQITVSPFKESIILNDILVVQSQSQFIIKRTKRYGPNVKVQDPSANVLLKVLWIGAIYSYIAGLIRQLDLCKYIKGYLTSRPYILALLYIVMVVNITFFCYIVIVKSWWVIVAIVWTESERWKWQITNVMIRF